MNVIVSILLIFSSFIFSVSGNDDNRKFKHGRLTKSNINQLITIIKLIIN